MDFDFLNNPKKEDESRKEEKENVSL